MEGSKERGSLGVPAPIEKSAAVGETSPENMRTRTPPGLTFPELGPCEVHRPRGASFSEFLAQVGVELGSADRQAFGLDRSKR